MNSRTNQGAETMTQTRCHGHQIATYGVAHVCTDLCTFNECCRPVITNPATLAFVTRNPRPTAAVQPGDSDNLR